MKKRLVAGHGLGSSKKFLLPLLLFTFTLISCVGGGDNATNNNGGQDAVLYQHALATYQAGSYPQALNEFQSLLSQYPNSIYTDNAQYYTARCHHEMNQFTTARSEYNTFIVTYPSSNYVDNAVFYNGKAYYDEAAMQTDPQLEFALLTTAVSSLSDFITRYSGSTVLDGAQYYLGRSYHRQAGFLQRDPSLSADSANQLFANARTYYLAIAAASVYKDNAQYYKAQTFHDQADYVNARIEYQILIDWVGSSWADDAKYQYAKTYYDEALLASTASDALVLFDTAITQFDLMLTDPLYQNSNQWEAALFYKGRGYQRQGDLIVVDPGLGDMVAKYSAARIEFQNLISQRPASVWADNAQYQTGVTDYDEAKVAETNVDYATMRIKLSDAVSAFNVVLTDTLYKTSNSADNAQYYLGRSYQVVVNMPLNERGANFSAVTYDTVRAAFSALILNFPISSWVDNAYFEIGNTYYTEGELAADNLTKETAFNNALNNYYTVVNSYQSSIRFDNSVYKIAWIYHIAENCTLELDWFNYHASLTNVSASDASVRDSHLADLTLAVPVSHVCPNPSTLSVSSVSAPLSAP